MLKSERRRIAPLIALLLLLGSSSLFIPAGRISARPLRPFPAQESLDPKPPVDFATDEVAKFISGFPCEDMDLRALQETSEWKDFAQNLEKNWADLESTRLVPMKNWARVELDGAIRETKVLFYPFGGPDFLTAHDLFPDAETYVLLGLEFVGRLPVFDRTDPEVLAHVKGYLANLSLALGDFFKKSYFITKNMERAFGAHEVEGLLPLLCFFLERTGHTISSIKRCEFMDNGELLEFDASVNRRARRPYGIKIEFFEKGRRKLRRLYYFSADLEDVVFRKETSLYRHLDNVAFESTFLKSASYLLHYRTFSNIRGLILAKSRFVLEDDTGIPFRFFPPGDWDAVLYGEYIKPVSDFKGVDQPDLERAYAESPDVRKLPFHLGYHWGTNKDSILYFKRKGGPGGDVSRSGETLKTEISERGR